MTSSKTERLIADDKQYVWHPFTQMDEWIKTDPLIIDEGDGVEVIDVEGNRYIDGVSSLWTNVHGHRVPKLDKAVKDQLGKLAHSTLLGLANPPSIELARKLVEVAPEGLEKVFYSDSGSTAVEVALKMAFQYWRQQGVPDGEKIRFACVTDAYHGDTIGSVSVGGISLFHAIYKPLLFSSIQLPSPYCYRCPLNLERETCGMACADKAVEIIEENKKELAAVVMEPLVQGAAGLIVHPEGFLKQVAKACKKNDVLLILDEVAVGFGRTGKLFACEHEGVNPDFLCMAKGLSGGYLPLAATLAIKRIFDGFLGSYESKRTFFHGHTYTGNPLACAAAIASLDLFTSNNLLVDVNKRASQLAGILKEMDPEPHVGETRQRGLMACVELVKNKETKENFPVELRVGHNVVLEARKRGAILRPLGDTMIVMPPLSINEEQLNSLMGILKDSIAAVVGAL